MSSQPPPNSSDEPYSKSEWFTPDPPNISPSTRKLLEEYSKVPPDDILSHVSAIRDKAWHHHPYPCIGSYRFLDLSLGSHSLYRSILSLLRSQLSHIFLDLGCAFGQDLRRLRSDGIPGRQLYGCDLRLEFVDLGYELFRDTSKLGATFLSADIFAPPPALGELEGRVSVIHAASFFHLFSYSQQKIVAHACVRLLVPEPGSLVVGRQVGDRAPGEKERSGGGTHWRHDEASWRALWEEVGSEAGVAFEVKAELREGVMGGTDGMEFSVRRL